MRIDVKIVFHHIQCHHHENEDLLRDVYNNVVIFKFLLKMFKVLFTSCLCWEWTKKKKQPVSMKNLFPIWEKFNVISVAFYHFHVFHLPHRIKFQPQNIFFFCVNFHINAHLIPYNDVHIIIYKWFSRVFKVVFKIIIHTHILQWIVISSHSLN